MSDGFLSRWAKRKEAVRKGEEVPAEPPRQEVAARVPLPPPRPSPAGDGREKGLPPALGEGRGGGAPAAEQPPPPTLEDAQQLTPQSDFSRFVRADVDPSVKNAAMRKLFADPHFNRMDGLDIYIDDYTRPDPLPAAMVRKLASAGFLGLVEDEERKSQESDKAPTARAAADGVPPQNVAQSAPAGPAVPPAEDHADPDLRLQQDDAPGPQGPGQGPG